MYVCVCVCVCVYPLFDYDINIDRPWQRHYADINHSKSLTFVINVEFFAIKILGSLFYCSNLQSISFAGEIKGADIWE